uniref:Ribosomal protein L35A n=1 Tax=Oryza rufipogon TaxID=4529 RepID=A0A0E0PR15_ORYRU
MKGRQGQRVRLYVRGTILGYKRSKSNQYENTSLLQIEGVNTKEEVGWYAGKRIAYVYKAKTKSNDSTIRCIWGKVTRPHGNSGVVRAKFRSNLPPTSMGKKVRVFMFLAYAAKLIVVTVEGFISASHLVNQSEI